MACSVKSCFPRVIRIRSPWKMVTMMRFLVKLKNGKGLLSKRIFSQASCAMVIIFFNWWAFDFLMIVLTIESKLRMVLMLIKWHSWPIKTRFLKINQSEPELKASIWKLTSRLKWFQISNGYQRIGLQRFLLFLKLQLFALTGGINGLWQLNWTIWFVIPCRYLPDRLMGDLQWQCI